ncbi:MAG: hypothetical protein COB15_08620 [Flavobacteriales bacterium]|nr:MAG: hypothetical protein COB15_08620 [Flavobacteriales bacterium]
MNYYLIKNKESVLKKNNATYLAILDGERVKVAAQFLKEIGGIFKFPDYYGENMNALNEMLNDLDWLESDDYSIVIENFNAFLSEGKDEEKYDLLRMLNSTADEWKSVPNFDGEENFREKKEFNIYIIDDGLVEEELKKANIQCSVFNN